MQYANEKTAALYARLTGTPCDFPVRFVLDGLPVQGFPAELFAETGRVHGESAEKLTDEITLAHKSGLTVLWKAAYWKEYGASEYTVWLENRGDTDTPVLSDFACLAMELPGEKPVLRGNLGDHENEYAPYTVDLEKESKEFVSTGGRATHVYFPYFNLEHEGGGLLIALGWMGTWRAGFAYADGKTRVEAAPVVGMKLPLHPGEKIRLALTVLIPYAVRNEDYAMNLWRRWFIGCNMPRADRAGNPVKPFSTCCLASDTGLPNSDGSISERSTTWRPSLEKMYAEGVKTDFRWFDAGWYYDPYGQTVPEDWWGTVGTWVLDREKWPEHTFRDSVDFAHEHDQKTLVWFEPQRVTHVDGLVKNYGYKKEWAIELEGTRGIVNNIGDPACYRWTVDRIKAMLGENHVDMYREDFNFDPGDIWKHLDERDGRVGITEIRVVMAHYDMWDELIAATSAQGGCAFCDSCASGGGINDVDTLRRGIPLLRSDADRTTTALRLSMSSTFLRWVPFCGANTKEKLEELSLTGRSDPYTWRASYLPALNVDSQFVQDPDQDFDVLRFGLEEWKEINPYLLKDFYPLTPWHSKEDKAGFTAFAYFDPEAKRGVLLLFRQEDCEEDTFALSLARLGERIVSLRDKDSGEVTAYTENMIIAMPEKRMARLFFLTAE